MSRSKFAVAGVTRRKFAVLTVGGLHKLRYRRALRAHPINVSTYSNIKRILQANVVCSILFCGCEVPKICRCGCEPLQIRRSDAWQFARVYVIGERLWRTLLTLIRYSNITKRILQANVVCSILFCGCEVL